MRIGIVIPAFNVAPWIDDALRSLRTQTHTDWIATVVDDGSTDGTADIVMDRADPRVRLIRQPNAGVSVARNRGLDETDAPAILFLDADDWLHPEALSILALMLQAESDSVAVVGAYRYVPGPPREWCPPRGDLLRRLLVRNLFANGGHLLIRRRALGSAGYFRADLRYGEDWEYWTRLARLGPFVAAPIRDPLLFVRRRPGAYLSMAARPESFRPCMEAIYAAPELRERFDRATLARLRWRAEAENDWIVGRELIRHGRPRDGRPFLLRSVLAAPSVRRLTLLAMAGIVPMGPFRRYALP